MLKMYKNCILIVFAANLICSQSQAAVSVVAVAKGLAAAYSVYRGADSFINPEPSTAELLDEAIETIVDELHNVQHDLHMLEANELAGLLSSLHWRYKEIRSLPYDSNRMTNFLDDSSDVIGRIESMIDANRATIVYHVAAAYALMIPIRGAAMKQFGISDSLVNEYIARALDYHLAMTNAYQPKTCVGSFFGGACVFSPPSQSDIVDGPLVRAILDRDIYLKEMDGFGSGYNPVSIYCNRVARKATCVGPGKSCALVPTDYDYHASDCGNRSAETVADDSVFSLVENSKTRLENELS